MGPTQASAINGDGNGQNTGVPRPKMGKYLNAIGAKIVGGRVAIPNVAQFVRIVPAIWD